MYEPRQRPTHTLEPQLHTTGFQHCITHTQTSTTPGTISCAIEMPPYTPLVYSAPLTTCATRRTLVPALALEPCFFCCLRSQTDFILPVLLYYLSCSRFITPTSHYLLKFNLNLPLGLALAKPCLDAMLHKAKRTSDHKYSLRMPAHAATHNTSVLDALMPVISTQCMAPKSSSERSCPCCSSSPSSTRKLAGRVHVTSNTAPRPDTAADGTVCFGTHSKEWPGGISSNGSGAWREASKARVPNIISCMKPRAA